MTSAVPSLARLSALKIVTERHGSALASTPTAVASVGAMAAGRNRNSTTSGGSDTRRSTGMNPSRNPAPSRTTGDATQYRWLTK
jgi:hypothetical protein